MNRTPTVELGWNGDEYVAELLNGASGFTSYPDRIELGFTTTAGEWRESLRSTTVHEYAHVWGYEERGRESETKWEYVLEEAFTQHVAEEVVPEYRAPWWTKYDEQTVGSYWDRIVAEELDEPSEDGGSLYVDPHDDTYPLGLGYALSYQLGDVLKETHSVASIPTLDRDDLLEAGNTLYRTADTETADTA